MIEFSVVDAPDDLSALPMDTVPDTVDVEYPCKKCGREAGPYGGRGRKPTLCAGCKPARKTGTTAPRVTGTNANLAAQATEVLSQLNAFVAMGAAVMKMFNTSSAIAAYDETFKGQAYAALVTDPELCRFILKGGVKSAKLTLAIAYGGMGIAVAPTAFMEFKEMKAARNAARGEDE